jgi:glycosyltransferase involved in cell wall biosynthesis
LEAKTDLKQFILCPEDSVLAGKCASDNAACFTYRRFRKFKHLNAIRKIITIVRNENIDIVHVHDSSALNAALIACYMLPKKTRLVLSRKRNNRIKPLLLNHFKYSHPRIAKIISVSNAVASIFDRIIKNKDRLLTIYDGIDVDKFANKERMRLIHEEFSIDDNSMIIGNIAGLTHQKDLFTFLDTAKEIKERAPNKKLKYVIVGDGPLRNELETYAAFLGMSNEIIFAGFRNDIADLLPEFDVLLLTSVSEGLPLTIYEAFSSRVPVVATDAGGIKEVITDYETGFVTKVGEPEELANRVLEILDNNSLANEIREKAFNLVKNNHDLPVVKENYYRFYKSLA